MGTPEQWLRKCPYCEAQHVGYVPGNRQDTAGRSGEVRNWITGHCPVCGGVAVFEMGQNGHLVAMHPEKVSAWDVGYLPPTISSIWDEAAAVYGVGAYRSAVVICGRTLEQAAIDRNVKRSTLQKSIEQMLKEGLVTAEFKGAMDYVRLIRNVGAHAGREVSSESAEGTMRFTQQTLRLLFEVPGELQRLTGHPPELDANDTEADSSET